jgi:hypothetical protein
MRLLLHYATGLALVAVMLALWTIAFGFVVWACFAFCSVAFPWIGRRHRHTRWQELNTAAADVTARNQPS